jgi:hypothetical protein
VVPTRITLTLLADPEVFLEHPDSPIIITVANSINNMNIGLLSILLLNSLTLLLSYFVDPIAENSMPHI